MKKILFLILLTLIVSVASAQYSAVRINALGIATGTINAGIDLAVTDKWSVDLSGYWNPIKSNAFSANVLAATVGVRRWRFEPHVGFFYGTHITASNYKIGNSNTRYNGWLVGIGGSVGYSWMLAKRWNFSMEGGLSILYMKDTKWNTDTPPTDDITLYHNNRVVLAPSKLEASFSYLF